MLKLVEVLTTEEMKICLEQYEHSRKHVLKYLREHQEIDEMEMQSLQKVETHIEAVINNLKSRLEKEGEYDGE
jgi:predicted  nucleic acid-binding Zn ribbon protein